MADKPDVDLERAREFTRRFAAINEMPGEWQELFRSQLSAELRAVRLDEAKWWDRPNISLLEREKHYEELEASK